MKNVLRPFPLLLLFLLTGTAPVIANAQDPASDPGAYITAVSNAQNDMNKTYMAYVSTAAHSSRKRKIERQRQQTIESITNCKYKIAEIPLFKGDNTLRQSSMNYVQLCYKVFNEDYAHIVNMEDISEQSYDGMQAYLLLQEATNDTLKAASERINKAVNDFAAKYNVKLIEDKSELGEKMEAAGKLSKYRDKVYLLFFKCSWEDNQLTEAVNKKNVSNIEQVKSALYKYAVEGLATLDTTKAFENDPSLATACRQALNFYKKEAESEIAKISDFFIKQETFDKLKKEIDAKAERTQQDVDAYNKAVKEFNAAVNQYNQVNNSLNNGRNQVVKNWNDAEKAFTDTHTPYYK